MRNRRGAVPGAPHTSHRLLCWWGWCLGHVLLNLVGFHRGGWVNHLADVPFFVVVFIFLGVGTAITGMATFGYRSI